MQEEICAEEGLSGRSLRPSSGEAALRRRESDMKSYLTTEPVRNRLLRAWEVVCAHYQSIEAPLPAGFDVGPFACSAEETIHRHWVAVRARDRDGEPPPSSTPDHARSRSPPRDGVAASRSRDQRAEQRGIDCEPPPRRDPRPEEPAAALPGRGHDPVPGKGEASSSSSSSRGPVPHRDHPPEERTVNPPGRQDEGPNPVPGTGEASSSSSSSRGPTPSRSPAGRTKPSTHPGDKMKALCRRRAYVEQTASNTWRQGQRA